MVLAEWRGSADERSALDGIAAACLAGPATFDPPIRAAGLAGESISRPGRRVDAWLARVDGAPAAAGFVTLVETPSAWSIGWLVVAPAWRRRGLASALVAAAAGRAEARGARTLAADTLSTWVAASAFWRSLAAAPRQPLPERP